MQKILVGLLLCTGLLLGIAACASPGEKGITPAEATLGTCETYTDALEALLPYREAGKIGAGTLALIDKTRDTVDPLCLGPAPDINASVKDLAIDNGSKLLSSILLSVLGT